MCMSVHVSSWTVKLPGDEKWYYSDFYTVLDTICTSVIVNSVIELISDCLFLFFAFFLVF